MGGGPGLVVRAEDSRWRGRHFESSNLTKNEWVAALVQWLGHNTHDREVTVSNILIGQKMNGKLALVQWLGQKTHNREVPYSNLLNECIAFALNMTCLV